MTVRRVTANLGDLLATAEAILGAAGVDSPRTDAEWLAVHAFGLERGALRRNAGTDPDDAAAARFAALVERRRLREPLQRILGSWEFWGLDLKLGPDTLIPRADTETLVDAVLRRRPERMRPWRILDLGTGSGAILLALLSERPRAWGLGVDVSPGAAAVAAGNADALNLSARCAFLCSDWDTALQPAGGTRFDIMASNPPYIPDREIDDLMPEVARHEPRRALAGGEDGLAPYRLLAARIGGLLAPGGLAALEHGADQGSAIRSILTASGLEEVETIRDLGGHERVTVGTARGP